jgi:vanillate O-demethylase ferredoxin subunit
MRHSCELQEVAGASFHFDDENEGRFLDVAGIVAAAPKDAHLYCCGPTPMLNAFEATKDWPRAQIHRIFHAQAGSR